MEIDELLSRLAALIPPDAAWTPRGQEEAGNFRCEGCVACEDCKFCRDCQQCRECTYCEGCVQCQSCVQSRRCVDCRASVYLQDCRDCERSQYLLLCLSCQDCVHCLGCVGLVGQQFCVLNQPVSQEAYFAQVAALRAQLEARAEEGWRLDRLGSSARYARPIPTAKVAQLEFGALTAERDLDAEAGASDLGAAEPADLGAAEPADLGAAEPADLEAAEPADLEAAEPVDLEAAEPEQDATDPSVVHGQLQVDTIPDTKCLPEQDLPDPQELRLRQEIEEKALALAETAAQNFDARLAELHQRGPRAQALRNAKRLAGQAQQIANASLFVPSPSEAAPREAVPPKAAPPKAAPPKAAPQGPAKVSTWTPVQLPPRKRR